MTKELSYKRGSEWRKWDLHIHSKYSLEDRSKLEIKEIFENAIDNNVSMVSITDHSNVDSLDEIWSVWEKDTHKGLPIKNQIDFLPGIEIRTNRGKHSVHTLVIFPKFIKDKKIDKDYLQSNFLNPLKFTNTKIEEEGDGSYKTGLLKICADFKELSENTKELGGLLFIHAGDKSGGIEKEMAHESDGAEEYELLSSLGAEKEKIMKEWVDVCELPNYNEKSLKEKIFYLKKFNKPSVVFSDSHESYNGTKFTWIKADPTFEGLKQILNEPVERIFLDIKPPKILEIEKNKSKYIDSIKIKEITNKHDGWFDDTIPLNCGLVAIIGRKGSGKSALADIISRCGNSKIDSKDYSFLNKNKFRKPSLAKNYEATLKWLDGKEDKKINLDSDVNLATEVERVKYLPQKFVETICNEDEGVSNLFQKEIDKVIFSYIPESSKIDGALSLDDLIRIKTESIEEKISSLHNELNDTNLKIVSLENKQRKEYSVAITKKLEEKKRELNALTQPKEIKKPKSTLGKTEQTRLDNISKNLEEIEIEISETKKHLGETNNKITSLNRIKGVIVQIQDKQKELTVKIKKDAESLSLNLNNIIKITVDNSVISQTENKLIEKKKELEAKLEQNNDDSNVSLYTKKLTLESQKNKITKSFGAEQKAYNDYCEQIKQFKLQQAKIEGKKDDNTLETIKSLEKEIHYVKSELIKDLQPLKSERTEILKKLYQELIKKMDFYKEIYAPLTDFIKDKKSTQEETGNILSFSVGMVFKKQSFMKRFFDFINRNRDGSFQNVAKGEKVLDDIIRKSTFKDASTFITFIDEIIEHLNYDKTKPNPTENNLRSQVKNGDDGNIKLYNFLFGLDYLDVKYKVLFNGKDLNNNEFSPGEKGALLLIFYLLIDRDNIPLIIDQPEENLDNESVYDLLVPYIKKAKEKRQIIAVTHNPNLAVVCDAEQIIYTHMDKKLNQIRYSSGSIENSETNKRIVDVLEGTMPAFKIRDKKYIRKK
ncbi:MAG: PHP domain-containing protein [Candidatus Paceibacterota bacterium]|jgi:hypothetical protein